ncbi:GNAT family N-acetyltransferase [Haloactinomyces albus]|uniref:GNAT superfamily N-acetyltransferase n=1 Tax=Haloactinomyces albus TaxID=1352928 RepID=A0AAE3ZBI9_9ACTN|nr:GNAT family N-acetyltransferase [Haloactinomyces albus]MDR7300631.1 GNAT superfamily N-acetyltransferase [Haloactinomyces albus]
MADADVRVAEPSDAAEIARIQLTTWRTAYAEILPTEVLDNLDAAETEQQWQDAVSHGPVSVMVATESDWTVGFCAAGRTPEQEAAAADGTIPPDVRTTALISTLLVEPRWGRRGHGGRLLGVMAQRLAAGGATRGIAWIPEADEASLAFFHSVGWPPDGTVRTLDAGGRPVRELRLSGGLDLHFRQD